MNEVPLAETDFEELLDRLGADLPSWPAPLQAQANALLARSAMARELLAEAERLQSAFDALPTPALPPGLRNRIVASAARRPGWFDWLTVSTWRPASLACIPLLLGFAVGAGFADDTADLEESVLVAFTDTAFADYMGYELGDDG